MISADRQNGHFAKVVIFTNDIELENLFNIMGTVMMNFSCKCLYFRVLFLGHGPPLISHQQKRTKSLGNSSNTRW